MAASSFTFTQSEPSTTWVVSHGFNTTPIVDVLLTFDDKLQKAYPQSVTRTSDSVLTITFSSPQSGMVRLAGQSSDILRSTFDSYFAPSTP